MERENEMHALVRAYVREQWNGLSSLRECDVDKKISILKDVSCLLPSSTAVSHPYFKDSEKIRKARVIFADHHYARFAGNLLDLISVDWISSIPRQTVREVIDDFYLRGVPHTVLPLLCSAVYTSVPSYKQSKCVHLLEELLGGDTLRVILLEQVEQPAVTGLERINRTELWEELLAVICSLPDKMASTLREQNSEVFLPASYVKLISSCLVAGLEKCHKLLLAGKDCSLEFSSLVLGKLCLSGFSEILWEHLLPPLLMFVKKDFIWVRLCERLITGIPDRCMESVIIPVLTSTPWYGMVEKLLGDCVIHNHKLQYLFCTKLLLMRHFEQMLLLQNVLGYLASSHTRKSLFKSCLLRVLRVWVDGSAIKHTSYQQHYYLSKALMICLGFVTDSDREEYQECLTILMRGMQHHLGNSDPKIRALGMVVAESFTSRLQPGGPQLQFEVTKDETAEELLSLLTPPEDPGSELTGSELTGSELPTSEMSVLSLVDGPSKTEEKPGDESCDQEELDSDDDLEPYDLSHDVKRTTVVTPHYIRDCMEGLIKPENPEQTEVCLRCAERLIRNNPDGLMEISAEFMKILLHLPDEEAIPEFSPLRFTVMVALTSQCPAQVAPYLTSEFYGENYNLRQRLDMLEVLSRAAQDLSAPGRSEGGGTHQPITPQRELSSEEPKSWQEIVQRRIEKKTRRFAKGRSQPEPVTSVNRFAPVAGLFFFPLLLQYDRKRSTLDLLGRDSLVLSRLVYTLGVVIHAAVNTPIVRQMGATGLEFLWALRYHGDGSVRLSVLFTCAMLFLSVPTHFLMTHLQQEVTEVKYWLQDVTQSDVDTECRKLALQVLVLLDGLLTEEFQTGAIS